MFDNETITAEEALGRLRAGNEAYLATGANAGDISLGAVRRLHDEGQAPYACIVACSDSRVVPEHMFSAGIGELFCVRVAGNVVGPTQLASCVYAAEHLHVPLIVVLGHTSCGAIASTLEAGGALPEGDALAPLVAPIAEAIAGEADPMRASILNVEAGIRALNAAPAIRHLREEAGLVVVGSLYHADSGRVEFL